MAAYYDLLIEQGATLRKTFTWRGSDMVPVDLTDYTARMQIRKRKADTDVIHESTTENGGITLGGVDGTVLLMINDADTAAFGFVRGVYDIELIDSDGIVTRLVEGNVELSKEVTR